MTKHLAPRSGRSISRGWRPGALTWAITLCALLGLGAGIYPMTAAWISSYNQSQVLQNSSRPQHLALTPTQQLAQAHAYNEALIAGVKLEADGTVPVSTGTVQGHSLRYADMLRADNDGLMARIKIPAIDVDLPIFHGTSPETLLRGAGHLEGSHLPVGGSGTRSVITAHRGLASATMFTNLDRVKKGDSFTVETLGEALVYRVTDISVIDPEDTGTLTAVPGKDLVTLITCTPLGINSQRILVTGERITPTPPEAVRSVGMMSDLPGFPWWIVLATLGLSLAAVYVWRRGYVDSSVHVRR